MYLNVLLDDAAKPPVRANKSDAGLDLCALKDYTLPKNTRIMVDTGVSVAIPPGMVGLLVARSSLSRRNIILTNSIGIIDSDYRGNILAALTYLGDPDLSPDISDYTYIAKGQRIVQLLVVPIALPYVNVVNMDIEKWRTSTERGTGGFGSSGV